MLLSVTLIRNCANEFTESALVEHLNVILIFGAFVITIFVSLTVKAFSKFIAKLSIENITSSPGTGSLLVTVSFPQLIKRTETIEQSNKGKFFIVWCNIFKA